MDPVKCKSRTSAPGTTKKEERNKEMTRDGGRKEEDGWRGFSVGRRERGVTLCERMIRLNE